MTRVAPLAIAAGLLAAGCAEQQYVYEPAVNAKAQMRGFPAAYYNIPTANPTGDVRLASFGVAQVRSSRGGGKVSTIEVRMIVANNSDSTPWTIDTREVMLSIQGVGQSRPLFVNTDAGKPPILSIARGQRHRIDLFYPMPSRVRGEGQLPAFDLLWKVQTSSGQVAERTPFEREKIEPVYAGYYDDYWYPGEFAVGLGYGPYWWYDPFFPGVVVGPGPFRVHRCPHHYVYGFHGRAYAGHFGGRGFGGRGFGGHGRR